MHSRGRNSPGLFANADFKSIQVGMYTSNLVVPHATGTMTILNGNDPSSYGRLHKCGSEKDMFEEISANKGTLPGVGFVIMFIQVS